MDHEKNRDMNVVMLSIGISLLVLACLFLIFLDGAGLREILGITSLAIVGLGLTVAATPDPRDN